jgi:hypothetical protein
MPQCNQNYEYSNKYKRLLYVPATVYVYIYLPPHKDIL